MSILFKCTTVLSVIVALLEGVTFGNIFMADYNVVDATGSKPASMMSISDVMMALDNEVTYNVQKNMKDVQNLMAKQPEPVPEMVAEEWYSEDYGYYEEDESGEVWFVPYDGSGRYNANLSGTHHSGSDFAFDGGYGDESGFSYTYYSENVLPGGGLDIPGRHVGDEGYVCDGDGNVVIASDDLPTGTVVDIPFGSGMGVVYDSGSGHGNLDIYTSW